MSHRGNGSTDSEYVNGHRESHFGGFAPIESQKVNVYVHITHTAKKRTRMGTRENGRGAQPEEGAARPSEDDFRPEN